MTETDDKLLKQFFGEQKQEIEDNGFSRRVMRNLPGRNHRLVQAWGAACAVVCVILFFTLGGLQATISTLREVFVSMVQQSATTGFDPKSLYIAALVLAFFGARKAWSMARRDHTKAMQDIQYNCPKNRRKTCFRTRDVLSL